MLLTPALELIDIMVRLKVPLVVPLQEDGHSCVPRCIKMIFMYISNCLEGRAPDLDIDDIAKVIETRADGTLLENVRNLNTNLTILQAIPSLEFDVELKMHSLSEIEEEIDNNRPVIAWVELSEGTRRCAHAVVIVGLDRDKDLIYYNDPMLGEKEEEIGAFMSRWESVDRLLIKVKIGKREQRLLDEYVRKEAKEE